MRVSPLGTAVASAALLVACATPVQAAAVHVSGTVATGLDAPWALAFLPGGDALVSERDSGRIMRVTPNGTVTAVGTVAGVVHQGEGGLLGIAAIPASRPTAIYAYETTRSDNRVVRIAWDGSRLGRQTPVLTGIPKSDHHNGGRILPSPDGTLFVATGDAGNPANAQDRTSLAGKILRIDLEGRPAAGNPFPRSPVYSSGHRNVQGLAFDSAGQLWASEFGEKTADELNLIKPGRDYGWPKVEGRSANPAYVNPFAQWRPTSLASPSGIAIADGDAFVASLRGEVLWDVPLTGPRAGKPTAVRLGSLGRLRTVDRAPDGSLWLVTNNTDGRGSPRAGDDRILRLTVG